jgi:hypothetical protein
MISDVGYSVSKLYGMLPAAVSGARPSAPQPQPDQIATSSSSARQEDQTDPGLSDDGRPQLRPVLRVITRCSSAPSKLATPVN